MPGKDYSQVTVVVPTLNGAETITELLQRLLDLYPGIKVIVADDISTDGTQAMVCEVARARGGAHSPVALLERVSARVRGLTASVIDGIGQVQTGCFAVMDGDLQHPPEVLGPLLEQVFGGADVAVGARVPYRENQGWHRIVMTRVSKWLARQALRRRGFQVSDPLSGLFAGKTALVQATLRAHGDRFEAKGHEVLFDLLRVIAPNIKVSEHFYQFGLRPGGHSKLRPAHAFYFLRSLFK